MAVKITGTILASIYFDNSSHCNDQSGFLLGEVIRDVKDTISDSQINNVKVETKIYVYDSVPCARDQVCFDRRGEACMDKISRLLKDKLQTVVGWYSFRRNSTLRPSYRERLVHQSLIKNLGLDPSIFTLLLCSEKSKGNQSNHVFDHTFLHLTNNVFEKMTVSIVNLGDTTHLEYKCSPSHTVSAQQGVYIGIIQQHERKFLTTEGSVEVKHILSMNLAITKQLEHISEVLSESEEIVGQLEGEVAILRERARTRRHEAQQKLIQANTQTKTHKAPVKEKQPSVDELLFMDTSDHSTVTGSVGQGHTTLNHPAAMDVDGTTVTDMQQKQRSGQSQVLQVTNKGNSALTTPVVLHSRSRSHPIDPTTLTPSQPAMRSRSRSGDPDSEGFDNKSNSHSISASSSKPDPFDFVGRELRASSKPSDSSVPLASKVGGSHSTSGPSGASNRSNPSAKNLSKGATAVAKNLNAGASAGKNILTKSNIPAATNIGSKHEGDEAYNPLYELNRSMETQVGPGGKKCSQEVGSQESASNDNSSSQDTYEMDASSSPVY